jgi:YtcA family
MSSSHQSCEHARSIQKVWMSLVTSLFLLAASGCSAPPAFNVLGSYFPSWLVCLGISIVLTFLAHAFVTRKNLADQLWPLPVVYSSLLCFFSCTLWLIFFE